jgi:hypothetical protein
MQKVVYKCDSCKREIGVKPHISLVLNTNSMACGIALPPLWPGNKSNQWRVERQHANFLHFCSGEHMGKYFEASLRQFGYAAVAKPKAKKKA